ncbi:MAG: hypothetical protein E7620_07650 [Ruminococcaceae bacterium]|nr:hypothetical protein [Oscillospiraceae bacterium]
MNGTAVLKGDTAILCSAAGFVNGTVAASIEFLGCSYVGSIDLTYDVRSGYTGGATVIGGAGFAYDSTALAEGGIVIKNSYSNPTITISKATADYVGKQSIFAEAETFTATNALDLTAGATLADVAKLDNGTLFNADGSFVWETAKTLTTLSGASIRTATPTGLRFSSQMSKAEYDKLTEQYVSVTAGTVIAPKAYVERVGAFTMEALETLGYSVNYLNVPAQPTENGDMVTFNGSVANIREANYQLEYVGRAYLLCVDAQGNETYIYADYEAFCAPRTVYYVATQALLDPNNGLSAGAVEAIQAIVDHVNGSN